MQLASYEWRCLWKLDGESINSITPGSDIKTSDIVYFAEKDFYKGIGGELRYKAEGLFKKAKEKGISIEDIEIINLKEEHVEFPGIGPVALPAYFVKVKGKHLQSGQTISDGKQIDYYNRYQQYVAEKIAQKVYITDEKGRILKENNRPVIKENAEFVLNDDERFEIGKNLLDDKEFGIEKTITGACDRVIRKLMGENDWLYPGEARLLDEEFINVQNRIEDDQTNKKAVSFKKATERQINYLKAKIKNLGINPDDELMMREILKECGFEKTDIGSLSTGEMSRIIDSVNIIVPRIKESMSKKNNMHAFDKSSMMGVREKIRQ